ncbi:formylglycine-generating enzyme family protein [Deltaproteobacteria bacterium TL4]
MFPKIKYLLFAMVLILLEATGLFANETAVQPSGYVWIPPGTFQMGGLGFADDERPIHTVTISQGFYLLDHEVTVKEYRRFIESTGYEIPSTVNLFGDEKHLLCNWNRSETENHPINCVSWFDAQAYIAWLNKNSGQSLSRLPTEAEWEYAARACTTTEWSSGDDKEVLNKYAWYRYPSKDSTKEVRQKLPNPWELYDMHGNVSEWVQDWYEPSYYAKSPSVDPKGPDRGTSKGLRGGTWRNTHDVLASANRYGMSPKSRFVTDGFRVAKSLTPSEKQESTKKVNCIKESNKEDVPKGASSSSKQYKIEFPSVPLGPPIVWEKTIEKEGHQRLYDIRQIHDQGLLIFASTYLKEKDERNAWVFKVSQKGTLEWEHLFPLPKQSRVESILRTSDQGTVILGNYAENISSASSAWILRLNQKGEKLWEQFPSYSKQNIARMALQTVDEGVFILGVSMKNVGINENLWALKLDKFGNEQWQREFSSETFKQKPKAVFLANDGGIIMVSDEGVDLDMKYIFRESNRDIVLRKLNKKGETEWKRHYGGPKIENLYSAQITNDGGLILAGSTNSRGAGGYDAWFVKLDAHYTVQWEQTFGEPIQDAAKVIIPTHDNGFIALGESWTTLKGEGRQVVKIEEHWMLKLDPLGKIQWHRLLGNLGYDPLIQQTSDKGYLVVRTLDEPNKKVDGIQLIKLNQEGEAESDPTKTHD